ncbi:MAG: hypothetical protein JW829_12850 [Pirellulales bacterium]|nr:hypothetical protein [Pirellulales bacterium]
MNHQPRLWDYLAIVCILTVSRQADATIAIHAGPFHEMAAQTSVQNGFLSAHRGLAFGRLAGEDLPIDGPEDPTDSPTEPTGHPAGRSAPEQSPVPNAVLEPPSEPVETLTPPAMLWIALVPAASGLILMILYWLILRSPSNRIP